MGGRERRSQFVCCLVQIKKSDYQIITNGWGKIYTPDGLLHIFTHIISLSKINKTCNIDMIVIMFIYTKVQPNYFTCMMRLDKIFAFMLLVCLSHHLRFRGRKKVRILIPGKARRKNPPEKQHMKHRKWADGRRTAKRNVNFLFAKKFSFSISIIENKYFYTRVWGVRMCNADTVSFSCQICNKINFTRKSGKLFSLANERS